MYERINVVYKKCGQTPLDCINEVKNANAELFGLPLTYAGRLDPLAEGVLIILAGDECLKKDEYLKLSKEYEVDILFGFTTDTYDVMGLVMNNDDSLVSKFSGLLMKENNGLDYKSLGENFMINIKKILTQFIGKVKQPYPPYSSRPVNGKPLFMWAREGKLNEIEIPSHDVFVESIEIIKEGLITGKNFLNKIKSDISSVKGDFRQEEIVKLWETSLVDKLDTQYKTITIKISCGSGVYVRGIAHELGKKLGVPALALKIVRTKVGDFKVR